MTAGAGIPLASACRSLWTPSTPNILLITLAATRADHLGCYGYFRTTSPNIDAIADSGIVYTSAYSTSSWTLPAHASLFTGMFPTSHGARYDAQGPLLLSRAVAVPEKFGELRARGLGSEETTLAGMLGEAGYDTGAVVAGPWLKRMFGLHRAFAYYDDHGIDTIVGRRADSVTQAALSWIDVRKSSGNPFFLFLNYFDPHGPYDPPRPYARRFKRPPKSETTPEAERARANALYDGEIAYMDRHIGVLMDWLKQRDLFDRTYIIVTSDHGEQLGEKGRWGHGLTLSQQEIRVPMIVKPPLGEARGERRNEPIQLIDVLPLIASRLEQSIPATVQGGIPPQVGHPLVAEVYPFPQISPYGEWRTVIRDGYKFLWNGKGQHELYNLVADPGELNQLLTRHPTHAQRMQEDLETFFASLPARGRVNGDVSIDEETRRALERRGYVK